MASETTFAAKLDLALKASSIARGRLAAEIGVDKSMISRWLSGGGRPSTHNLERLTRLVAAACPGFTMLDWESDLEALGRRLGIGSDAVSPEHADRARQCHPGHLPFGSLTAAAIETARRASAYIGRWQVTRLSGSGAVTFYRERLLIRPDGDGMRLEHRFATHMLRGWLIVSEGTLYSFVSDSGDGSFAYYCLHGVVGPRAVRLDGIHASVGGHRATTPFAQVIVLERVGDLSGDDDDDAWGDAGAAAWGEADPAIVDPAIISALGRDFGPATVASGGEAVLRVPLERSLASGGY